MPMLRKITYTLASLLILTGCSHARYGEDIVFSHSIPPAAQISTCSCEPLAESAEDLQVTVYFGTDLYSLNEEAITTLESLVHAIDHRSIESLTIVGHTDSRATHQYNDTLSMRRATSVIDYLKGRGLDSANKSVGWKGEMMPTADNDHANGMAKNRRTVISARVIRR